MYYVSRDSMKNSSSSYSMY